ncbi:MAG: protein phosphatase 2C domain-containing protein [Microbacteriaceae bacterium]|jgi:protein phosphatase|nr:protein phosphatase 2C domain-containing protein [Microbacteriaceae bacterium]MCI1207789.1 protein phosphatase 2C domain-containing protein [Microbacteriaceae bacterium]
MPITHATLLTDRGRVRLNNQDSGYIGTYLFVVADGMGGHAGGDIASAITINRLTELDREYESTEAAASAFHAALLEANRELTNTVLDYPELTGMGTTVSGMIVVRDQAVIAHIGDSRIYRYRNTQLSQITKDHTFVQRLVDLGRITPQEALVHPRRSVIMRVLGDVEANPEIDLSTETLEPGDRWMICSDGVSGPLGDAKIAEILGNTPDRDRAAATIITATLEAGAPDNCTCALIDPLIDEEEPTPVKISGSAAEEGALDPVRRVIDQTTARHSLRAVAQHLRPRPLETALTTETNADEYLRELIAESRHRTLRRRIAGAALLLAGACLALLLVWGGWNWTQRQYYVGPENGYATVYQGINANLGPIRFSHPVTPDHKRVPLRDLTTTTRTSVERTIPYGSQKAANAALSRLRDEADS